MDVTKHALDKGARYPYDQPDDWLETHTDPMPAVDWAHAAARGVLADLSDRRGIKHALGGVDEAVRMEVTQAMAAIIRRAAEDGA